MRLIIKYKYFSLVVVAVVAGMGVVMGIVEAAGGLSYDFYKDSCPDLENIVKTAVRPIFYADPSASSAFLRFIFHDCQVQGCDASLLLDSDDKHTNPEIDSIKNFGVKKRESIGHIKLLVEAACPGQVSCADILALASKEAVSFAGGPSFRIPLGRRDSTSSNKHKADVHLPGHSIDVDKLLKVFMPKGMDIQETVAILGAHTLGIGHCINIVDRLYNPDQGVEYSNFAHQLQLRIACPTRVPFTNTTYALNDLTPVIFDNQYYRDVKNGKGLFGVDYHIGLDERTRPFVEQFAEDQDYFFQVFSSAFVKLSTTHVLTGNKGEIRRQCNKVN